MFSPSQKKAVFAIDEALGAKQFEEAYRLAKPHAEAGEAWAETCLGMLFMLGLGVSKDVVQAEQYFTAAAGKEHGGAWYSLGELYSWGGGPDMVNSEKARRCYSRAEELGYYPGQPLPGIDDRDEDVSAP